MGNMNVAKLAFVMLTTLFLAASTMPTAHAQDSGIDYDRLADELAGEGLQGRIHGSVADQNIYVFTWRDPENFFRYATFPLAAYDRQIVAELASLSRHDKVKIKGEFIANGAPQRHIFVEELEVIERWQGDDRLNGDRKPLPQDIIDGSELIGKVHAVADEGRVLVVEYMESVIPVFVNGDTTLTRTLFRNDKIKLHYVVRSFPGRPVHLSPNPEVAEPVVLLDRLVDQHDQPVEFTGYLVKFPASPQIIFDVFALQLVDIDGVRRNYTLVNFEDPDVFAAIRAKLGTFWTEHEQHAVDGRNKLINRQIRVTARGTGNVVSPNQANPQILLDGPEALTLEFIAP